MEVECLRFCFMGVLQQDLDEVRCQWNTHRIRPSAGSRCPPGIPDELFYLPTSPWVDCMLRNIDPLPLEITDQLIEPRSCDNPDCESYFSYLCTFHGWPVPHDADSATELYFKLLQFIQ